jgi:membrane protease YdiL (CAAX protease family)
MTMKPLYVYYGLAFGITWGAGGLGLLVGLYDPAFAFSPSSPLCYLAGYGPSIAGLILVGRLDGFAGIKRLLARALPTVSGLPWHLGVIVGFAAVNLVAGRVVDSGILARLPRWDRLLYMLPFTLVTDTGPIGEEFGWRGFALPFLLRRRPPLAAALILGVIWAFWHLPAFFIPTLTQYKLSFLVFVPNSVALSVIMTWLYRRNGGDMLLMILVHLMANYCAGNLGVPFNAEVAGEVVCAALIVAAGGLRTDASPNDQGAADGTR